MDGIDLPLERLKIEAVPEADKEKLGVDKEAHLFEVFFLQRKMHNLAF